MVQANLIPIPTRLIPASAIPATYAIHHSGWIPIIRHPERARFLQEERFPRKVKATAVEAIDFARRTIAWRKHFADFKRRRLEAIVHPRYLQAAE